MGIRLHAQLNATSPPSFTPVRGRLLQRKTRNSAFESQNDSAVPPIVHEVLRSPGQPLDAESRAFMEPRFGHDFSNVRVHTGERAANAASTVDVRAYTVNRHIVFGAGEYAPQTESGLHLLSHELTHVVQQRAGVHLMDGVGQDGDEYERQAEAAAARVAQGGSAGGLSSCGPAHPSSSVPTVVQFQKGDPSRKTGVGLDPTSNPALGVMERANLLAQQDIKPKRTRPPEIIKLAFLGFTQESGGWKDEVAKKTSNVFSSRDTSGALSVLKKHFNASEGPFDIRIAGYSWGGWTALELASDLVVSHKILDLLGGAAPQLSISVSVLDPVSTARSPVLGNLAGLLTKVFNIYQTNGCFGDRCISFLGKLFSGQAIPGATNKDVTTEGRGGPELVNNVPSTMTPDHVHLGYQRYGGYDKSVAQQLDG
jgi:uncharacterized protein DUF4157